MSGKEEVNIYFWPSVYYRKCKFNTEPPNTDTFCSSLLTPGIVWPLVSLEVPGSNEAL